MYKFHSTPIQIHLLCHKFISSMAVMVIDLSFTLNYPFHIQVNPISKGNGVLVKEINNLVKWDIHHYQVEKAMFDGFLCTNYDIED